MLIWFRRVLRYKYIRVYRSIRLFGPVVVMLVRAAEACPEENFRQKGKLEINTREESLIFGIAFGRYFTRQSSKKSVNNPICAAAGFQKSTRHASVYLCNQAFLCAFPHIYIMCDSSGD